MLYFIATPIGNLKDISIRALEVLKEVDLIACEDTRHSLKLLSSYEIKKPLMAYHKFNEQASSEKIIAELTSGKNVAVISDAGTPVISDPGSVLIDKLIEMGLEFTVIPGACAFVPALLLSGLGKGKFLFYGFLPEKNSEIKKELTVLKDLPYPIIFYSAPHDIKKTVKSLFDNFGDRRAVAVREITKLHEERVDFNLSSGYAGEERGEFVIVVQGSSEKVNTFSDSIEEHYQSYIDKGYTKNEAIKQVAKDRGVHKNEIYSLFVNK